jgi:hypothetical protein
MRVQISTKNSVGKYKNFGSVFNKKKSLKNQLKKQHQKKKPECCGLTHQTHVSDLGIN